MFKNRQLAIGNRQSPCVLDRLASLLEHLAVPNEAGARIGCQLKVLSQFQARSRAGLLAERTEHAARSVKDKFVEHFFLARLAGDDDLDVHRQYVYAIFRTSNRAKVAGDAKRVVRFRIHVESRRAMETRGHVWS